MRVGLIGYGAVGQRVARGLAAPPVAVLVRQPRDGSLDFVYLLKELCAARPDVVLEAASPEALTEYALAIVESGATLIAASGSGLQDESFRARLSQACRRSGARIFVPSGALGGLDALAAAAVGGLDRVRLRITDPQPEQPAFEGSAWEGIRRHPGRLNVAAAVALAARRDVDLTVQHGPRHELCLEASGPFGEFSATMHLTPERDHIVALSLLQTLHRLAGPGRLGGRRRRGSGPD